MFFPIGFSPFIRATKRLLSGPGSIESAAFQIETIYPEETREMSQAYFFPEDLTKITGTYYGTSRERLEEEIRVATDPKFTHCACMAYHLRDAVIFDGRVYAGNYKLFITNEYKNARARQSHLERAALVSSFNGSRYFGHWLADDCTQYELASERSLTPISMSTVNYAHKSFYAGYFEQDWSPVQRCQVNDLIVFQDYSQSSEKRRRYEILRAKLAAKIGKKNPGALIYLRRGNAGVARAVENEDQIEKLLASRGFIIVDPSVPNPREMLETLIGANLIVSIEGSHLYPFLYTLSQNGSLLVLEPPDRFNLVARDASECLGIKFGFIVGANVGTGYRFSTSDLLRMIDLLGN